MPSKRTISLSKILIEPKLILISVVAGALLGYFLKPVGALLAPYGIIYVSLLTMCILPMMITAIISGLGHMLRCPETRRSFKRMICIYGVGFLVPGLVAMLVALIGQPGAGLDIKDLSALGEIVLGSGQVPVDRANTLSLLSFVDKIVPHNVFAALSEGRVISIVFISMLTGLAFGLTRSLKAEETLQQIRVIFDVFELIFSWVIYLLPLGLFCLIAGLMSMANPVLLQALFKYMLLFGAGIISLLFLYHCLLWGLVGGGFLRPLKALHDPLILTLATNSSIVAIPACMEAVHKNLAVDEKITELIVPFGIIANRHGVIFLFAYTTIFLTQIYDISLNFNILSVSYLATGLAGLAAEGHGAAIAPLLVNVLEEICVPVVLAPVVLAVTFPIVGRLENLLTIYANCIMAVWVGRAPKTCPAAGNPSRDGGSRTG